MSNEIVFGIHAVSTLLRIQPERLVSLSIGSRDDQRVAEIIALAASASVDVVTVPRQQLDALVEDDRHQGVVANVIPAQIRNDAFLKDLVAAEDARLFLLILDEVQDPHNLGACLRSADGAGVHAVVIPRRRSVGLTAAARKVACGAAETVPLVQVANLSRSLKWLAGQGVRLIGLAEEAETSVYDQDLTGPLGVVLGGEKDGLRRLTREYCEALASLPMHGMIDSLNVSVAAGICLYEARRQRRRSESPPDA